MNNQNQSNLYQLSIDAARFMYAGGKYAPAEASGLANSILSHQYPFKGFVFFPASVAVMDSFRLISGEAPRTLLLKSNAYELEILHLLSLLQPESAQLGELFHQAEKRLSRCCFSSVCTTGECTSASIAYQRFVTARGWQGWQQQTTHALEVLKEHRKGGGQWRKFPYFFTLLWLTELPLNLGEDELMYASEKASGYFKNQKLSNQPAGEMRELIVARALQQVGKSRLATT
jgi:hypothetical protein